MKYLHANGYACLTKENFWDDIKAKYPDEFEHFSKWIDEYKKKVDWDKLFANGPLQFDAQIGEYRIIKYHNLPIAMQFGIFLEFAMELRFGKTPIAGIFIRDAIPLIIYQFFATMRQYWHPKNLQHDQ